MRRAHVIGIAVLAALLAAGATAQEIKKVRLADAVTIMSVDDAKRTFRVIDVEGREFGVLVDSDTRILRGDDVLSIESLDANDRVVIEARKEMEGEYEGELLVADRVLVVVAPADATDSSDVASGSADAADDPEDATAK